MGEGKVVSIYTAPAATVPMSGQLQVQAVAGKGLEGDRYFAGVGTFWKPMPDREVTLIEVEAIEALERDYGLALAPSESRRNIVTRGVALNHLVGREFQIGEVTLRGIRLCEPCAHLQRLTREGVIKGLAHRGGLRAHIVTGGTIAVGDRVAEVAPPNQPPSAKPS